MTAVDLSMPPFHIMDLSLDDAVNALLTHDDLDRLVDSDPHLVEHLGQCAKARAHQAFVNLDHAAMETVHRSLFAIYEQHFTLPGDISVRNQLHPVVVRVQHELERKWEAYEISRCRLTRNSVPTSEREFLEFFNEVFAQHRATEHPVYDFLLAVAAREHLIDYFTWDATLNLRFYDVLIMSMIGADGAARQELVGKLLDETGRGYDRDAHTSLFQELLDYVGRPHAARTAAAGLPWQGLAGCNHFLNLAIHRKHYFRLVGSMSITEQLDPRNYVKLLGGCRRVGLTDERKLSYYSLHIVQEVEHGAGWNEHLMLPALSRHPAAAHEIMLGALMRLNTARDYHDALLEHFQRPV